MTTFCLYLSGLLTLCRRYIAFNFERTHISLVQTDTARYRSQTGTGLLRFIISVTYFFCVWAIFRSLTNHYFPMITHTNYPIPSPLKTHRGTKSQQREAGVSSKKRKKSEKQIKQKTSAIKKNLEWKKELTRKQTLHFIINHSLSFLILILIKSLSLI